MCPRLLPYIVVPNSIPINSPLDSDMILIIMIGERSHERSSRPREMVDE